MSVRRPWMLLIAVGLLAGAGCSKTQDTAPEQRIFGAPPVIQNVTSTGGAQNFDCDMTKVLEGFMCSLGVLLGQYTLSPGPDLTAHITYTDALVTAKIVDPEDTATTSDILLATTSYQEPRTSPTVPPNEISLVMFDGGGTNTFPYQQTMGAAEDCVIDVANGVCGCTYSNFKLTAN